MSVRKFDGIDNVAMFDMSESGTGEQGRQRYIPPAGWGECPACTKGRVGLVLQGGHLVWKLHWVATWGGAFVQCQASGSTLCAQASRVLPGVTTPICQCVT